MREISAAHLDLLQRRVNAYRSLSWGTAVVSCGQTNAFPCWSTKGSLSFTERFWYLQLFNSVLNRIILAPMPEMTLNAHLKRNIVLARRFEIRIPIRKSPTRSPRLMPCSWAFCSLSPTELAEIFTASGVKCHLADRFRQEHWSKTCAYQSQLIARC